MTGTGATECPSMPSPALAPQVDPRANTGARRPTATGTVATTTKGARISQDRKGVDGSMERSWNRFPTAPTRKRAAMTTSIVDHWGGGGRGGSGGRGRVLVAVAGA